MHNTNARSERARTFGSSYPIVLIPSYLPRWAADRRHVGCRLFKCSKCACSEHTTDWAAQVPGVPLPSCAGSAGSELAGSVGNIGSVPTRPTVSCLAWAWAVEYGEQEEEIVQIRKFVGSIEGICKML